MTPKQLSNELGISASAVTAHIKKLESLGLIKLDYTKKINGITAKYYALEDVSISLKFNKQKDASMVNEQEVFLNYMMNQNWQGFLEYKKELSEEENQKSIGKVAELSEEERRKSIEKVAELFEEERQKSIEKVAELSEEERQESIEKVIEWSGEERQESIGKVAEWSEEERQESIEKVTEWSEEEKQEPVEKVTGDVINGVAFLTDEDAATLKKYIVDFLAAHSKKQPDTKPWSTTLLAYPARNKSQKKG